MHILLTADPFIEVPPRLYGGIERIIAQLAHWLRDNDHTVSLLAHPDSKAPVDHFASWPEIQPAGLGDHLRNARALRKSVGTLNPDVVHSFSRAAYLMALAGGRQPLVISYQREPTRRTIAAASRLLGRRLQFTGCSEYIASQGRACGGRWQAIHNFVDCRQLPWRETVSESAPLVFLSRVESIKGAHLAIDIARRSGRRLLIAGNHASEGHEAEYFETRIRRQLGPDVEYVGPVDDQQKGKLLSEAAAMVLPIQWNEPFGIVFAEALACGAPVITCPRGAAPEIIRHGREGFLIDSLDDGVAAVARLDQISRADCRSRAEQAFDVNSIAARYLGLYEEILNS